MYSILSSLPPPVANNKSALHIKRTNENSTLKENWCVGGRDHLPCPLLLWNFVDVISVALFLIVKKKNNSNNKNIKISHSPHSTSQSHIRKVKLTHSKTASLTHLIMNRLLYSYSHSLSLWQLQMRGSGAISSALLWREKKELKRFR